MCRQNHSYAVDYFAVGVIGYEFMLGKVKTNLIISKITLMYRDHIMVRQGKI